MTQRDELRLTEMTEENLQAAMLLLRECFASPWPESVYRRDLADPQSFALLCMDGDTAAGFIHCSYVLDELTLNTLAVAPAYRRQGIAGRLWKAAAARVQEICKVCYLEVREGNLPARSLYASLGFVQNGYRPRYYSDPEEAAVLMAMQLP